MHPPKLPQNKPKHITLIGMMGSGKSTVGKGLASELQWQFFDCDEALTDQTGKTIAQIFDSQGEGNFRLKEEGVLKDLLSSDTQSVIATGGGAVLSARNRRLLIEQSYCVLLNAEVSQLANRLGGESQLMARPLISKGNTTDSIDTLSKIWHERKALYQETAHHTIDTDPQPATQIVRDIALWYKTLSAT